MEISLHQKFKSGVDNNDCKFFFAYPRKIRKLNQYERHKNSKLAMQLSLLVKDRKSNNNDSKLTNLASSSEVAVVVVVAEIMDNK